MPELILLNFDFSRLPIHAIILERLQQMQKMCLLETAELSCKKNGDINEITIIQKNISMV